MVDFNDEIKKIEQEGKQKAEGEIKDHEGTNQQAPDQGQQAGQTQQQQ